MDDMELKKAVKAIKMSEEMENRLIQNCSMRTKNKEVISMNMRKQHFNFRKPITIVAVVVLCLCVAVAAAAAFQGGHFIDITNWAGTVTGTGYAEASDEISVAASATKNNLSITVTLLDSQSAPYAEFEQLQIGSYKIINENGAAVATDKGDVPVDIVDAQAIFSISLNDFESGNYKLMIDSFVGSKKADQPLEMSGSWECDFTA